MRFVIVHEGLLFTNIQAVLSVVTTTAMTRAVMLMLTTKADRTKGCQFHAIGGETKTMLRNELAIGWVSYDCCMKQCALVCNE